MTAAASSSVSVSSRSSSWWRVANPQQPVRHWHVGPLVEVVAYHFSWLIILVPLLLSGDQHPVEYLALWGIGITSSFVHRHVTMPYVYLDEAVLHTHLPRFTVVPVFLFCGFVASAALQRATSPPSFFTTLDVAALVVVATLPALVWWRDKHAIVLTTKQLVASVVPACAAVVLGLVGGVQDVMRGPSGTASRIFTSTASCGRCACRRCARLCRRFWCDPEWVWISF